MGLLREQERTSEKVDQLFKRYLEQYRRSYPTSPLDVNKMNLTFRVFQGRLPVARGHFSDVYKGVLDDKILVGVKILRLPVYQPGDEKLFVSVLMRFFRELNHWCQLDHVNVAPLLGFIMLNGNIGFVSTWYQNGNVADFLKAHPDANKHSLALDAAEGVKYLHTCLLPLIHGDLKAVNVLVNEHGVAVLSDFGISKQVNDMNRTTGFTTTSGVAGTIPWMAPELFNNPVVTFESDVYSFGGLLIEIYCPGKFPYHYISQGVNIILAKNRGDLPDRCHYPDLEGQESLWDLILSCFAFKPQDRPSITDVVNTLYKAFDIVPRGGASSSEVFTLLPLGISPTTGSSDYDGVTASTKTPSRPVAPSLRASKAKEPISALKPAEGTTRRLVNLTRSLAATPASTMLERTVRNPLSAVSSSDQVALQVTTFEEDMQEPQVLSETMFSRAFVDSPTRDLERLSADRSLWSPVTVSAKKIKMAPSRRKAWPG